MPQDNPPNSQPPSGEPRRRRPQRQSRDETQPRQTNYQTPRPFWKDKIIQLLRGTIGVLETTVNKLEAPPVEGETPQQGWWDAILISIRSILPSGISSQLSDTALSGIIAVFAVVIVWGSSSLFAGKPTKIATVPPQETPPTTITTPEPEVVPTPSTEEPTPPVAQESTPPVAEESTPPVVEKPSTVPEEPTLPEPEPEAPPTPTPKFVPLTPEETLIAAIENRVAEVSQTSSGLVKSIQANFRSSSLIVTISDDWYTLKNTDQDKLAADIFERSKELDFSHLEMFDSQDRLIARNPVVGNNMIIFQRKIISQQGEL